MATTLYVTEYADTGMFQNGLVVPQELGTDQIVNFSGGSTQSTALKNNTRMVRLHADSICSVLFGTNPTATTSNRRMAAGQTEYFLIPIGQAYKVAAVTNT